MNLTSTQWPDGKNIGNVALCTWQFIKVGKDCRSKGRPRSSERNDNNSQSALHKFKREKPMIIYTACVD